MNHREIITRLDGTGVDGDKGTLLIYRIGDDFSIVATTEQNGDAEVILDKSAMQQLVQALLQTLAQTQFP